MTDRSFTEIVEGAIRAMLEELILERRKTGEPLVVWQNDRVEFVSADQVKTPSELEAEEKGTT